MTDLCAGAREWMIEEQLRARGIANERVLDAMRRVPREVFVPPAYRNQAYEDRALPLIAGQTISQPFMVARACDLAGLQEEEIVLEVGAGSGYQAAILAELAKEVISVERLPALASYAREALRAAGIANVTVVTADGSLGWPARAPYDCIVVAAAAPEVPQALADQLADGGRLVIPVGDREIQTLKVFVRRGDALEEASAEQRCSYVPLLGEQGWRDEHT